MSPLNWTGRWLVLALLTFSANAANVYVRQGAGGSNNGTDWVNAYTSLRTAENAAARGSTIYVAGGSYGQVDLDKAESGATITFIKKATIADHGTATGWSDAYDATFNLTGPFNLYTGYWEIDGQTRNADWRSGYGIKITNPNGNKKTVDGKANGVTGASHVTFRYVEFQGIGLDNTTYDNGINGYGMSYIVIDKCYMHDYGAGFILSDFCNHYLVQYSVFARNSSSAAEHAEGWADQGSSFITNRYSVWEDVEGTGCFVCLNRDSNVSICDTWETYGNIFMYHSGNPYNREGTGNGLVVAINKQIAVNWKFYNNIIVNWATGIPGSGISSAIQVGSEWVAGYPNNSNVLVYNNFWWKSLPAAQSLDHCAGCSADYNRYDNTSANVEAHGQINATASTNEFVNYLASDFHLTSATINGTNLAAPYDVDLDGTVRGSSGLWTVGAYQYGGTNQGGSNPPPADVTPPVVVFTNPPNAYVASNTVTLGATATDAGGISNVAFFKDWVLIGNAASTNPPYTFDWNTRSVNNDVYTMWVVATDNSGNQSTGFANSVINLTVTNSSTNAANFGSPAGVSIIIRRNISP